MAEIKWLYLDPPPLDFKTDVSIDWNDQVGMAVSNQAENALKQYKSSLKQTRETLSKAKSNINTWNSMLVFPPLLGLKAERRY